MTTERGIEDGGLGPFDPEMYLELEFGEFRLRFPAETMPLTDEQIWNVVSAQDDDRDDAEWRKLFKEAATS